MDHSQAQTTQEGTTKKGPLDNLTREELIKKCKGLLGLAQKAKQAKDEIAEENKTLKDELNKFETQKDADKKSLMTMKEMVDSFAKDKLSQTTIISDLQLKVSKYEKDIKELTQERNNAVELSIENESLKRQIQRLGDENEELLSNLENMEKKLDQVNQFGMQQQKDLILLEETTANWKTLETSLRKSLDESEKEIACLKNVISNFNEEKSQLTDVFEKKNKDHIIKLQNENEELQKTVQDLSEKLNMEHPQSESVSSHQFEELQKKCNTYEELCAKQADELDILRKSSEIQNSKLQNFKVKLIDVTLKLKKLKKTKQTLAEAVQEYYLSIPKWQKEMQMASNFLCLHINSLGNAKKDLENKVTLLETELRTVAASRTFYENRLGDLIQCCNKVLLEDSDGGRQQREIKESEIKDIGTNTEATNDTLNDLVNVLKASLEKVQSDYDQSCKHLSTMQEDFNKQSIVLEAAQSELNTTQENLQSELKEREILEQELKNIKSQMSSVNEENQEIEKKLKISEAAIEKLRSESSVAEERHSDLLGEMRELNEALKGRGDVISRQQDKIIELEKEVKIAKENLSQFEKNLAEKDNLVAEKESEITKMSKDIDEAKHDLASTASQIRENEKIIKNLLEEISSIRERATDTQSEVLSTSTVSRVEESMRMKEVDESFEEKYNKLRSLAIKLKKKVQEQANQISILESDNKKNFDEKNEIRTKLGSINVQVKNLQVLQNENDKLLDEIEKVKKEKGNYEKQIKELTEKMNNLAITGTTTNSAIQEYQNQIKFFKQEKESFNLIRKEWESEREMLKNDIIAKEKELNTLRNQHEKIKSELEKCKAAGNQSNVLNLEIEAYEKSLNEATQNLKIKETLIKDFQESLKNKDEFIESNKKEIKLLEESLESERIHSAELKQQIDIQQAKFKESEHEKSKLRERLQDLTKELEDLKSQTDEARLELSELTREKEHLSVTYQKERDDLYWKLVHLQENSEKLTAQLRTTECELEDVKTEYANYKVRAQSVLRQNQTKETSRERELEEEVTVMRSTIEKLNLEITNSKDALISNEKKIEELRQDNERIQKRCKDLMQLLEETRIQNEAILEDNRKQSRDYQESLKAHRLQIDAINNCYKKQVEELEKKHATELEELKKSGNSAKESKLVSRLAPFGGPRSSDEQKIDLILMEREDAEGSETSVPIPVPRRKISSTRSKHDLIPLDELLNTSIDENVREDERSISPAVELQIAKERLQAQESRVRHLTSLLSETEQDLAKLTQLNEVLKEEVRRHERSVEREQHIQNSEYLKNIVLKFLTLHSGDERVRLVPVLNTILKLSPEETHTLQNVAKGTDMIQRTWGSYLPIWSNHQ